jgi:hypothetical protein
MIGFGQYSNYYQIDKNVDVKVSGKITTTLNIKTIDYGQLALAEAYKERNRLANLKYVTEKEKLIALEIADDPSKAYKYGITDRWRGKGPQWGFGRLTFTHKRPHKALFTNLKEWKYQNISQNHIRTDIKMFVPVNPEGLSRKDKKKHKDSWYFDILSLGAEEYAKLHHLEEGEFNDDFDVFLHKKDINKAKVCGRPGFLSTLIYEDDYEYVIKDNYYAVYDGIVFRVLVKYSGDKDEITFEDLEGRRYYFKRLCNQIISTARCDDYNSHR